MRGAKAHPEDEYGVCANCQEELQQKRLSGAWAKHCIACQERWSRIAAMMAGTVESTALKTRHYGSILESSITATYIPSLIKMQRRVEFCLRGDGAHQRHSGGKARGCACCPGTGGAGSRRSATRSSACFFFGIELREAPDEREPGSPLQECLASFERCPTS